MSNPAVAQLIAQALPALVYPGDGKSAAVVIPLPTFRNTGIPADQAEAYAKEAGLPHMDLAQLVAESIVHLLETNGYPLTSAGEVDQLRLAAADREHLRHRQVEVSCNCGAKLFKANVTDFDTDKAKISPQVIKALRSLSPECALAHQPVNA
jgi:hypothetical protein